MPQDALIVYDLLKEAVQSVKSTQPKSVEVGDGSYGTVYQVDTPHGKIAKKIFNPKDRVEVKYESGFSKLIRESKNEWKDHFVVVHNPEDGGNEESKLDETAIHAISQQEQKNDTSLCVYMPAYETDLFNANFSQVRLNDLLKLIDEVERALDSIYNDKDLKLYFADLKAPNILINQYPLSLDPQVTSSQSNYNASPFKIRDWVFGDLGGFCSLKPNKKVLGIPENNPCAVTYPPWPYRKFIGDYNLKGFPHKNVDGDVNCENIMEYSRKYIFQCFKLEALLVYAGANRKEDPRYPTTYNQNDNSLILHYLSFTDKIKLDGLRLPHNQGNPTERKTELDYFKVMIIQTATAKLELELKLIQCKQQDKVNQEELDEQNEFVEDTMEIEVVKNILQGHLNKPDMASSSSAAPNVTVERNQRDGSPGSRPSKMRKTETFKFK